MAQRVAAGAGRGPATPERVVAFDGAALTRLRQRPGPWGPRLTLDELARRSGIARPNLIAYEKGRVTPGVDALARLARALGVDPLALTATDPSAPGLVDLRVRRGISRTEMARRLGLARSTFRLVERGEARLHPAVAARMARVLGVPLGELEAAVARPAEPRPGREAT